MQYAGSSYSAYCYVIGHVRTINLVFVVQVSEEISRLFGSFTSDQVGIYY